MRSKVSSDWLPSYIKPTRPVLEIFKTNGYFPFRTALVQSYVEFFFHKQFNLLHCSAFYSYYTLIVRLKTVLQYSITRIRPTAIYFTQ